MCTAVTSSLCISSKAVLSYNKKSGRKFTFMKHSEIHTRKDSASMPVDISASTKATIVVGAAHAVVQRLVPLSFTENHGMQSIA